MATPKETKRADDVKELISLGEYDWPRSETQQTLGHLIEKIKRGFGANTDEGAVDVDTLKTVSNDAFETSARDALSTKLCSLLDQKYLDWATSGAAKRSQRLFVYPPMDVDILSVWASDHGLPIVDVRSGLDEHADAPCIIIPKLESYFARRHDRLDKLFDLFAELSKFKGRVLVGCNSWALQAIKQFDDLRLLLGQADTFPAFNANALADILEDAVTDQTTFTSVTSGVSVFKRDDDSALCDPFLDDLVDQSLGHPWVAIEMFFQGITEAKDEDAANQQVWIQLPEICSLPDAGKDILRFALHALLIHGKREVREFDELLPNPIPNGVWSELDRTGFVDVKDGTVSCAIRNYPDIRKELSAAGFNLDKL